LILRTSMRRLVWISVLAFALAVPAVGFALSGDNDGTLSVRAGTGKVSLYFNGSAVGRLQHGAIQVTDPVAGDGPGFEFSNCDVVRNKSDTTTNPNDTIKLCRGDNIRFRAIGGKYQIKIWGTGIYLSVVGHGYIIINGAGDDPNVDSDGTYSLNDGPYRSLPDLATQFTLATPSGG
jgi:hypothetical protein